MSLEAYKRARVNHAVTSFTFTQAYAMLLIWRVSGIQRSKTAIDKFVRDRGLDEKYFLDSRGILKSS